MTMTTLSSEGRLRGLCGGMIKRNRSFMLYFGVLLFVLYPLQYMLHIFDENFDQRLQNAANGTATINIFNTVNGHHNDTTVILVCMAVFAMTLVIGLAQFGYLHSKKAVDVYHELPVTRSTLVAANLIAGFVTVMLPLAANYLAVLAVGTVKWLINPLFPIIAVGLLADLFCWAVVVLAVLCVIAFVAVQVGSVFDNFVFSCELLVLFPALIYLTLSLFQHMLRGYQFTPNDYRWILYTSPVTLMAEYYAAGNSFTDVRYWKALAAVAVWLLIILLLLWATLKIYRRRPSEIAESSTNRKPLVQLGVLAGTYIGGTLCGLLFSEISGRLDDRWSFVIWTVIFSALIYVMAQVVLQRGFKGIGKTLLPGAVTVGVIAVFCVVLATGGFGYESRLPAAADVATVNVNYRGRYGSENTLLLADSKVVYEDAEIPGVTLYRYNGKRDIDLESPEGIEAVLQLHQVAGDRSLDDLYQGPRYWSSELRITYTLHNGKTMTRYYDYSEVSAIKSQLIALENTEEFKQETHPVFLMDATAYGSFVVNDALGLGEKAYISNQADMQRLMDALKADMLAEDLTKLEDVTELAPCYITFEPATPTEYLQLTEDAYNNGSVTVRSSYTNTLQVLRQLGLEEFAQPQTQNIASMRVYYDGRFYHSDSPINMMDMKNLDQYAKEMHYAYDVTDQDALVLLVEESHHLTQIMNNMFNFGCVYNSPMSVVFYDADGNYGGCAQIDAADLPKDLLNRFPQWVWEEKGVDYPVEIAMEATHFEDSSVGVIGGADGPTAIYVTE